MPSTKSRSRFSTKAETSSALVPVSTTPVAQDMLAAFQNDPRLAKRQTKERAKDGSLVWRRGPFSSSEIEKLKKAVDGWISEAGLPREEARQQLIWGRDNRLNRVWSDIGQRSGLFLRELESIRKACIRHCLTEKRKWSNEDRARIREMWHIEGERSWKAIAKDLDRTLEETENYGRYIVARDLGKQVKSADHTKKVSVEFTELERTVLLTLRSTASGTQSQPFPVHNISWKSVADAMNVEQEIRQQLASIYGDILKKCMKIVDESHPNLIDRAILYRLYLGVQGMLGSLPCFDLESIDWPLVCPFLTIRLATHRALTRLKNCSSSNFVTTVQTAQQDLSLTEETDGQACQTAVDLIQGLLRSIVDAAQSAALLN